MKIVANENKIILSDDSVVEYDILALNLGSKTKGTTGKHTVEGVWEHSLTTRPINDLLPKIIAKENKLKADGIIPDVVIVGGGAAGTELAFAFKARWTKFFGQDIKVQLLTHGETVLPGSHESTIKLTTDQLLSHGIDIVKNAKCLKIEPEFVDLEDGRRIHCNAPIWATGAEA